MVGELGATCVSVEEKSADTRGMPSIDKIIIEMRELLDILILSDAVSCRSPFRNRFTLSLVGLSWSWACSWYFAYRRDLCMVLAEVAVLV